MEKLFNQISTVTASIIESEKIISNIREWKYKTAADFRELEKEKVRLDKATAKKLALLDKLEQEIRAERLNTTGHVTAA